MQIVVEHKGGIVLSVQGADPNHPDLVGSKVFPALFELSGSYPNANLVWIEQQWRPYSNPECLDHLDHPWHMISYHPGSEDHIHDAVAYVEDSPFVSIDNKVSYPTWKMSPAVGAVKAQVLAANRDAWQSSSDELGYALNSFAKQGQKQGLFCYSEPSLLKGIAPDPSRDGSASMDTLFRFVRQHYRTRWIGLLLLNLWVYERRLPLTSLLKVLFHPSRMKWPVQVELPTPVAEPAPQAIEVVIPTIGRASYLKDVLKDLAAQTLLPQRIWLMEQTALEGQASELDYLAESWPFKIEHRLLFPPGACRARNLALAGIRGQWVFLADDDIRLEPDFLSRAIQFMTFNRIQASTFSCLQQGETEGVEQPVQWGAFGSGCSLVRSRALDGIHFDPALEFGYGEDKDFGMQLRRSGVDVFYQPQIRLLHLKAPMGGFRQPIKKPWESGTIIPKPSPNCALFQDEA